MAAPAHTVNAHMWPCTAGIHTYSTRMLVKKLNSGKISGIRIQMEGNVQAVSLLRSFVMAPAVRTSSSPIGGWSEATMAARKKV